MSKDYRVFNTPQQELPVAWQCNRPVPFYEALPYLAA